MDIKNKQMFSKEYTFVIKGIAVIMLLLHHMFWKDVAVPINIHDISYSAIFVPATKTCVALFTILSGYGLYESSKKWTGNAFEFIFKHEKKLMIGFWWVYLPVFIASFFLHRHGTPMDIYGHNIKGVVFFVLDGLGLKNMFNTPSLNQTWWYMETIIMLYIMFPLLKKIIKRFFYLPLIISFIVLAAYNFMDFIGYEREILYLLPFVAGMMLSEKDILNKLANSEKMGNVIGSVAFMLVGFVSCLFFKVIGNTFFALAIIILTIETGKYIDLYRCRFLITLGIHSMNIFLIHSFLYSYFRGFRDIFIMIGNRIAGTAVLLILSVVMSIALEKIKFKMARLCWGT